VLQHNTVFATEGYARRWLIRQINQQRVRDNRTMARDPPPCASIRAESYRAGLNAAWSNA
jgi:hypothetical protein